MKRSKELKELRDGTDRSLPEVYGVGSTNGVKARELLMLDLIKEKEQANQRITQRNVKNHIYKQFMDLTGVHRNTARKIYDRVAAEAIKLVETGAVFNQMVEKSFQLINKPIDYLEQHTLYVHGY